MDNIEYLKEIIDNTDYYNLVESFGSTGIYTFTIGSIDRFNKDEYGYECMMNFTEHSVLKKKLMRPATEELYFEERYVMGSQFDETYN